MMVVLMLMLMTDGDDDGGDDDDGDDDYYDAVDGAACHTQMLRQRPCSYPLLSTSL